MTDLRLTADPAELLSVAGGLLARQGLVSTVVATTVRRDLRRREAGGPAPAGRPYWFAVALEDAEPVGVAMRAAERAPHPLFVLPMPEGHARALAALLHERGEDVRAVNGALPACRHLAEEYAARAGLAVDVRMHTRLHRLAELRPPPPVPGRLRPVEPEEATLAAAWLADFARDVEVQAGRPAPGQGSGGAAVLDLPEVRQRVDEGRLWWWDHDGPVHLVGASPPADGVARIAPVHTPGPLRGRGYAAAAVAALCVALLERCEEVCLFTDQANPVSNRLYERLGFEPVAEMVDLVLLDSGGDD